MNDAMVELLVRLEQARHREARAFALVTVDRESGEVIHATGPFGQAEHALIEGAKDEADWKRSAESDEEAESLLWVVVPLWEPSA